MERRSFLGSVIGSVFSLPFFARLETEEWQRVKLPYRMLFRDSRSGFTIQAPEVAQLELIPIQPLKQVATFRWIAAPLHVTHTMSVDSSILLTEQGKVIREMKFDRSVTCIYGDTLNVKQDIVVPEQVLFQVNALTHETLVQAILDKRLKWN